MRGPLALELKALERQPANATFRLNLAKIYLAAGEKSRAKTELDAVAKLGDKNPLYSGGQRAAENAVVDKA